MLRFYGGTFAAVISQLERAESMLMLKGMMDPNHDRLDVSPLDAIGTAREAVTSTVGLIKDLPIAKAIKLQADRLAAELDETKIENDYWRLITLRQVQELKLNVVNDLSECLFLLVPSEDKNLYGWPLENYWGKGVASAFPDAQKDMSCASKLLALGMGTASVFHSMQVVQHGLRRLADRFQVVFAKDFDALNWGEIIKTIEKHLKALDQQPNTPEKSADIQFGVGASSHFFSIKEAWRNYVMHGRSSYDVDEARIIAANVREIMKALC
jgi:hypothetical protein